MIWCNTGPHQPEGMWVPVVDVHSDIGHILNNLLGTIETSRAATYDSESVLFVRFDLKLIFDILFELAVVILGIVETEGTHWCLQEL